MRREKRAKLEAAGWAVGSVKEFLGLSEADAVLIELKLALSRGLRDWRKKYGLSQVQLAERLQSSQSRVAKMEAGDPSVSMDLLVSAFCSLGHDLTILPRSFVATDEARPVGPPEPSLRLSRLTIDA